MARIKKSTSKVIVRKFKSIADFDMHLENTPVSALFAGRSLASERLGNSFAGTSNYEQSRQLMLTGDKEAYNSLKSAREAFRAASNAGTTNRRVVHRNVAGFMPNVPATLMNLPDAMFDVRKQRVASRVLNVMYNPSADYTRSVDDLRSAGEKIAKAVYTTEAKGVRVNLWVVYGCHTSNEHLICVINVKTADQYGNLLKTAYPMTNPSMLRRQIFKLIEREQELTEQSFTINYGLPSRNYDIVNRIDMKFDIAIDYYEVKDMSQKEVNAKFSK